MHRTQLARPKRNSGKYKGNAPWPSPRRVRRFLRILELDQDYQTWCESCQQSPSCNSAYEKYTGSFLLRRMLTAIPQSLDHREALIGFEAMLQREHPALLKRWREMYDAYANATDRTKLVSPFVAPRKGPCLVLLLTKCYH